MSSKRIRSRPTFATEIASIAFHRWWRLDPQSTRSSQSLIGRQWRHWNNNTRRNVSGSYPFLAGSSWSHKSFYSRSHFRSVSLLDNTRERRYFSDDSSSSSSSRRPSSSSSRPSRPRLMDPRQNALDKFTHYMLNTQNIPLGTMTDQQWLDVVSAIEGWVDDDEDNAGHNDNSRGFDGFAVDSAHRLLKRLQWEQHVIAVGSHNDITNNTPISRRWEVLDVLSNRVIHSWFGAFYKSGSSSVLALKRIEDLLQNTQATRLSVTRQSNSDVFQLWLELVQGYLLLESPGGLSNAYDLLLSISNDLESPRNGLVDWNNNNNNNNSAEIKDDMIKLVELFESAIQQCISIRQSHDDAKNLLKEIDHLVKVGILTDVSLSEETQQMLVEGTIMSEKPLSTPSPVAKMDDSIQTSQDDSQSPDSQPIIELTPFEVQALEQKLIQILKDKRQEQEQQLDEVRPEIESMIGRLSTLEVSSHIVIEIIQFYVSLSDVENASKWLQKVDAPSLLSTDVVDQVLDVWSNQKGRRTPWQAEFVFKGVLDKIDQTTTTTTISEPKWFNQMMKIWLAANDDSVSNRKVVDLFHTMHNERKIKPDADSISLVLEAVSSGDITDAIDLVIEPVFDMWSSLDRNEKVEIAELVLRAPLGNDSVEIASKLLALLRSDRIEEFDSLFQSYLSTFHYMWFPEPSTVMSLVNSIEGNLDMKNALSLYTVAIQLLVKNNIEKSSKAIDTLFLRGLNLASRDEELTSASEIAHFVLHVVAMFVNRKKYSEAEKYLIQAEKALLETCDDNHHLSPIPLECYKRLIVRKWYTEKNSPSVETTFRRLKKLARSGYSNLQPDPELYTAFIRALAAMGKANELEPTLNELVEAYKASNDDSMKPTTESFNVILLSNVKNSDPSIQEPREAMKILKTMEDLGVSPDVRTLNLMLQNWAINKNYRFFSETAELSKRLQHTYNIQKDSYTRHMLLDACAYASSKDRDIALKRCLSLLHEIRLNGEVGRRTYDMLSKVIYRLKRRGDEGDKVASLCLSLCCDDGWLTDGILSRFQKSMTVPAYKRVYNDKLLSTGLEPKEWRRNVESNVAVKGEIDSKRIDNVA